MKNTKKDKQKLCLELQKMFENDKIELNYSTDFQLLCAVMWSAQTTDIQVNKASEKIFDRLKTPKDAIKLWEKTIRESISSLWFFNTKAKHTLQTAKILEEKYNWEIPQNLEELITLPWVWIKTAKVVLSNLYDLPYLAVDTHVHRVLNRLWFVKTKTAEQTDKKAEEIFDNSELLWLHHRLVLFWRYFCKAQKPNCENNCPFKNDCNYYKKELKKN